MLFIGSKMRWQCAEPCERRTWDLPSAAPAFRFPVAELSFYALRAVGTGNSGSGGSATFTGGESTDSASAGGLVSVMAGLGSSTEVEGGGSGGDLVLEGGAALGGDAEADLGGDVMVTGGSSQAATGGEIRVSSASRARCGARARAERGEDAGRAAAARGAAPRTLRTHQGAGRRQREPPDRGVEQAAARGCGRHNRSDRLQHSWC